MKTDTFINVLNEANNSSKNDVHDAVLTIGKKMNSAMEYIQAVSTRQTGRSLTKDTLLQFPILVPKDRITEQTMVIMNKALEHEYVSYILLALNSILVTGVKEGVTVGDLLKRIHTNVSVDVVGTMTDAFQTGLKTVTESTNEDININELTFMNEEFNIETVDIKDSNIEELNKLNEEYLLYPIGEELNGKSFNEGSIPEYALNRLRNINEAKDLTKFGTSKISVDQRNKLEGKGGSTVAQVNYNKVNALAPTLVTAKIVLNVLNSQGQGQIAKMNITFGVKTVFHPIPVEEYIDALNSVFIQGKFPVRLIKFLTGEMKARDFFFHASSNREKAIKAYGRKASGAYKWFSALEDMAAKDKTDRLKEKAQLMTAVTTMLITKDEAVRIKNKLNQNIYENPSVIWEIYKKYFIMNFMILDEAAGSVFIFDNDRKDFNIVSLTGLKAIAKEEIGLKDGVSSLFA